MDTLVYNILQLGAPITKVDWVQDMMSFGYKLRVLFVIEDKPYTWMKTISETDLKETLILSAIYEDTKCAIQQKINEVYDEEQEDEFKNAYADLRVYGRVQYDWVRGEFV